VAEIILCKTSDVAPGSVIRVEHDELGLAVYNIEGVFYATDDRCTHGLSSLAEGALLGDEIECAMHFGTFDVKTGAPTGAPCSIPLKTYKVSVRGDDVVAEI
jgi:nitrite reductase/ring-hydroxylating ferredoxin subunit